MSSTTATTPSPAQGWDAKTIGLFLVPIILLAGVIAIFALTDGAGLNVDPAAPVETITFDRTELKPGEITFNIRNTSPEKVTIAQISINDAIWPFTITDRELSRLETATITLEYPWVEGYAYTVSIFSSNSIAFTTAIGVAAETASASGGNLWKFTLVGFYVGIIPVLLGICWVPALRRIGQRSLLFLMAATVGLLIFLGIDAVNEAIAQSRAIGGPFQGIGLVGIGVVSAVILLDAISRRQAMAERSDSSKRLSLAWMIAIGMGLHNLGEGLAIGAAYAVGAATLGAFLVIGFTIQNITEGLGIVIPIVRDRPKWTTLVLMGLVGGAPAIAGAWIGGLVTSPELSVLFLALGAGAVFQVAYSIGRAVVWKPDAKQNWPLTVFSGVTAGMLALYITGVVIK